jgi:hypothetical protein
MLDFTGAINRAINKRAPQRWPLFDSGQKLLDRSSYVTASEIGYCARKIKFDKLASKLSKTKPGYTKTVSTDDWGYWERGHNVEAWVIEQIRQGWDNPDWELLYMGHEQVSFIDGVQSGTPDVAAVNEKEGFVIAVDIKSIDPRTNVKRLPKIAHVAQVTQNCDLMSVNMDLSPGGGFLFYIDASNYKLQYPHVVEWDEMHADRLQARAEMIMAADSPADLEPEGLYTDGCKYCNHTAACSQIIREMRNEGTDHEQLKKAATGFFG